MAEPSSNGSSDWALQPKPNLPDGYTKHHIVFLEAVHLDLGHFDFPHTIDRYDRTEPEDIAERIKDATIVISNVANVTPVDMNQAPHLQLVSIMATGMGWLDKEYCATRGISVTHSPGANIDAVSDHFFALYYGVRKRLSQIDELVHTSSDWVNNNSLTKQVWSEGPPLGTRQETLGIFGYGAIGKNIEKLSKAIGFKEILLAERKGATETRPGRVSFTEAIKRSTVLCLILPKTAETTNLIDEAELKVMRSEAIIINLARGGIVNEFALAKALKQGSIYGAGTDVLLKEPGGPGTSPLLPNMEQDEEEVPNCLVTPHVAWYSGNTISNLQGIQAAGMTAFVEGRMYDPRVRDFVVVHDGRVWKET